MPEFRSLKVHDTPTKVGAICTTIQNHFEQGDRIQVLVPSEQAAIYVDELLWKYPPESFLPHECTDQISEERVVITTVQANLNKAVVLLNLTKQRIADPSYQIIYELVEE